MKNPLQPRLSEEECERNQNWGSGRCDFNLIPIPAAVFGALFTLLTILHVYLATKYRKRGGIYWSLMIASFWSAIGYWIKFGMGGPNPDGLGQFATAYILMFLAVFWINGYIYYCLRHLYITYIPPRTVIKSSTSLFWSLMGFDICIWMIQIIALGFLFSFGLYSYESLMFLCAAMFFASFIMQLCMYITTLVFLTIFLRAANKRRKAGTLLTQQHDLAGRGSTGADYKPMVIALYAATSLLIIRALYYIVNNGTPEDGFRAHGSYSAPEPMGGYHYVSGDWGLKFHDPSQLGFDAATAFLALLILAWPKAYAARVLPRAEKKGRGMSAEEGRERVWTREEGWLELDLQAPRVGRREEPPEYESNMRVTPDRMAPGKVRSGGKEDKTGSHNGVNEEGRGGVLHA